MRENELLRCVVRICRGLDRPEFLGHGVLVAPGIVLSARHVIEDTAGGLIPAKLLFVESRFHAFALGEVHGVKMCFPHGDHDFALLELRGEGRVSHCATYEPRNRTLETRTAATIAGYDSRGAGVELLTATIVNRVGNYGDTLPFTLFCSGLMLSKVKRGQGEKGSEPFSKAFGNVKYLENDSMTQLLEQAFKVASGLPAFEQNALARRILAELDSERRWDAAFADSEDLLAELAAEALDDEQKGRTTPLDIDKL